MIRYIVYNFQMRGNNGSPWSTGSESPTPTNSVAERAERAARAGQPGALWGGTVPPPQHWPHMGEEHTQLLGTEEESSDRHSSDEEGGEEGAQVVAVGERSSSVWRVAPDQRRHYALQFQQLQPDARGLLPGTVARYR